MSLDLNKTAMQIEGVVTELKARHSDREKRLQRALGAIDKFSAESYGQKRHQSADAWAVPEVLDSPSACYTAPSLPRDYCAIGVDGSHIDVDRHLPVRCFMVNTGVVVLTYGSQPEARLSSQPRIYARDNEIVIKDVETHREQSIEGAVLGAKRTVEEIKSLVDVVRDLDCGIPTLALLDGSLVMLGLVGHGYHDFVLRELIEEGFVAALEELRILAKNRPLAIASYISLPQSFEVMNALRLMVCEYDDDSGYRCSGRGSGSNPCNQCIGGVLDRDVFAQVLAPGERSAVFSSSSRVVENHYRGQGVDFFYVNAGEEIGRVEMPSWVSEDGGALGLVHSLIIDQAYRGRGYPIVLMEAHEQAVVSEADRRFFVRAMETSLYSQGLSVYTSEKARSKRLRWL